MNDGIFLTVYSGFTKFGDFCTCWHLWSFSRILLNNPYAWILLNDDTEIQRFFFFSTFSAWDDGANDLSGQKILLEILALTASNHRRLLWGKYWFISWFWRPQIVHWLFFRQFRYAAQFVCYCFGRQKMMAAAPPAATICKFFFW